MANRNIELILKTNNNFQNNVQTKEIRGEQSIVPKIRVEATNPMKNRNIIKTTQLIR